MAIKKIRIKECPFCGNTTFTKGRQDGYASLATSSLLHTAPLYHIFCTECGSVVRSYTFEPKRFEPFDPY